MLRPVETPTREIKKLDGLWAFSLDRENCGIDQRWWESALQESRAIAVPGSFNDQFADADIRNYVGNVWYQREVFIPKGWAGQRIVLRFDAVTHYGKVWVNNQEVMEHQGGYTPFEADVTPYVIAGKSVRITVCVNNELNWQTIPPGMVITDENGKKKQSYFHDFFNYAGIHRSVMLYTTPNTWVDDITVVTHVAQDCNHASVDWQVGANGDVSVELRDADQQVVATGQGTSGTLQVVNPHLWQPGEGYLYELCVTAKSQTECDIYLLRVGIRSVAVKGEQFLINHKPFYFTGFGRHEDADLRGKGFDNVLMVHDHALMDWIGANSYRTSHYPYAEEMLDWADEHGIVVIDETAAVGFNLSLGIGFEAGNKPKELYSEEAVNGETQQAHLQAIKELIARDKNHPSVVMWSIANEPDTRPQGAREYFAPLAEATRKYTDVAGVGAAAAGTMLLLVRVFDAFADVFAGRVVDSVNTRWGKFRPFLLFGTAPLMIFSVLVFWVPTDWSHSSKVVYAYLTYMGLGLCYSLVNIPYGSLATAMTQQPQSRARLGAARGIAASLTFVCLAFLIGPSIKNSSPEEMVSVYHFWTTVLAIAGMVLYFICFKSTRENVVRIVAQPSLKISLQTLKRNRPLFMLCIGALCVLISTFAVSASSLFYVRYVLNDTGLFTVLVLVQNLVGTVASAPLVPGMVARIGKKNTFLIGALLGTCGYLLFFWVSVWSLPVALVALAIASIGQGVTMTVMWALEADTVEYGEYLTGVRIEGLTYSLFSFTRKCGQAIGGSIPAFILGLSGYIANQAQTPEVIMGIRTSIALVPCGFMLLAFVIIWFYPLTDKKFKEIVVEIDNRKKVQQQLINDITS